MNLARLTARFSWPLLLFGISCSSPTMMIHDPPGYAIVDFYPAWTFDGDSVLYTHFLPSSDGPAGLYLTGSRGGVPRFVAPVGLGDPECSPTARRACGVWGGEIVLVDLDSGALTQLTYTDNGPGGASWCPTGDSIVYCRNLLSPGESRDSAGLYLIDLHTGTDRPIKHMGETIIARDPQWGPRGGLIAFSGGNGIYLTDARGSRLDRLTTAPKGSFHESPTWIQGGIALLFAETGGNRMRTFRVDVDGDNLHQWPYFVPLPAVISPGDSLIAFPAFQPGTDCLVLFRRNVPDKFGYTVRQLTMYRPDSASALAVDPFRKELRRNLPRSRFDRNGGNQLSSGNLKCQSVAC